MKKTKLGSVGFMSAVFCLVLGGLLGYLMPEQPLIKQIFGGLFLVGLLAYFVVERKQFAHNLGKKTTQYGLISVISSLMALGILVVVNCISANYDVKKDLTKNKLHTLSEQSVKVIKNLKSEVTLRLFVAPNQTHEFDNVLDKYTYHTKMVKRDYIDVDKDPLILQKYNIKQTGVIIVESQNRTSKIENISGPDDPKIEEKITNAIISVAKGDKKKVYFISGH